MAFSDTARLKKILCNPDSLHRIYWVGSRGFSRGCRCRIRREGKTFVFYSDELPENFNNPEYESSNPYQLASLELIDRYRHGIVVDLGAGNPRHSFPNVCQIEIRRYPHTDIVTAGNRIPLRDASVDAVISEAVLEHVQNPFLHIAEIYRILKPDGQVLLDAAFMQPLHGYPHHYFNTTASALRYLMRDFAIERLGAGAHHHPWITLQWILNSFWFGFGEDRDRDRFRSMTMGEVMDLLTAHQEMRSAIKKSDDPWEVARRLKQFNTEHAHSLDCFVNVTDRFTEELSAGFQVLAKKPG